MKKSAFEDDNYWSKGSPDRLDALWGWNTVNSEHSCIIFGSEDDKETKIEFLSGLIKSTAVFMGIFYLIFKYWPYILEYLPYFLDAL